MIVLRKQKTQILFIKKLLYYKATSGLVVGTLMIKNTHNEKLSNQKQTPLK